MQLNFEKVNLEAGKEKIDPHFIPPYLRGGELPEVITYEEYLGMQRELMASPENIKEAEEVLGHTPTQKEASNYWAERYAKEFAEIWRPKLESETWH